MNNTHNNDIVILTRMSVSDSYTALLPSGLHLTVWPDYSAELVTTSYVTKTVTDDYDWCVRCCLGSCRNPNHVPIEREFHGSKVVRRVRRQPSVADALLLIAPEVNFGVREDGTFPVRAYMQYSEGALKAYPRIRNDLPCIE